jgi:hypothetical protein
MMARSVRRNGRARSGDGSLQEKPIGKAEVRSEESKRGWKEK